MTSTLVIASILFFPIYLALRAPYFRLPLHIDTGFYVSNHTVVTGKLDFSRGWNAHFAGCSKVLPEYFYSLLYLLHCRPRSSEQQSTRRSYKYVARCYATLYNYATTLIVATLAYHLSGKNADAYLAALIIFGLLSSEPSYGSYFECGEWLAIPWETLALLSTLFAIATGDTALLFVATLLWFASAYFVKLSAIATALVVLAGTLIVWPPAWIHLLFGFAASTAIYLYWIIHNRQNPLQILRPLAGHEISFGQQLNGRVISHRLHEKSRTLLRTFGRAPSIPLAALIGAVWFSPTEPLFWAYFAGTIVTYFVQSTDCWYYQIPLLPPLTILAVPTVLFLVSWHTWGWIIVAVALAIWMFRGPIHAARLDVGELNQRIWNGYRPLSDIQRNTTLERVADEMRRIVGYKTLLIYGPASQGYVLLHSSYETPLATAEHCLDDMVPTWQSLLNQQLMDRPPAFILDVDHTFASQDTRLGLRLDYRLVHSSTPGIRLFKLHHVNSPSSHTEGVRTYSPQVAAQVNDEVAIAPGANFVDDRSPSSPCGLSAMDATDAHIAKILKSLARRGLRRAAIYGAGRFTVRHRQSFVDSPLPIVVIVDDRPARHGDSFLGWPICEPRQLHSYDPDVILLSTDRFTSLLRSRAESHWGQTLPIVSLEMSKNLANSHDRQSQVASSVAPLQCSHSGNTTSIN